MAEANETEKIEEEKKEKDPNNKITGWDLLDAPVLFRKIPIGPSIEELQESKVDQLLNNKERPLSHTVKDTLAFILGNVAQEAAGAAIGAGINKAKGSKAISKHIDDVLEKSLNTSKEYPAITKAARRSGNETTEKLLEGIDNIHSDRASKLGLLNNYDYEVSKRSANVDVKKELFDNAQKEYDKAKKVLSDVDPSYRTLPPVNVDNKDIKQLSDVEKDILKKREILFNAEEAAKREHRYVNEAFDDYNKAVDALSNMPSKEALSDEAKNLKSQLSRYKNLLEDWLDGKSVEDIRKTQGVETIRYRKNPWNNNVKSAAERVYTLSNNEEEFLNWLKIFGDTKEGKDFLSSSINNPELFDKFLSGTGGELLSKIGINASDDDIRKYGGQIIKDWTNFSKGPIKEGINAVGAQNVKDSAEAIESLQKNAKKDLKEVARNAGKRILGNDIFGLKLKEGAARSEILSKLKKNKDYIKTFDKMLNPKDPLYKALAESDGSIAYKSVLADDIKKGMSVTEAIQDKALQRVIDNYDSEYIEYLNLILDYDVAPSDLKGIGKIPDPTKSPLRNADGTLKNIDELAEFLTKDPLYKATIDEYIRGLTGNANTFMKTGAIKGAALPLLARYAEREIKSNIANGYDPFDKKLDFELPANMKPWDSSTEFSVSDKLKDNASTFFGINFDQDPNRFSTKQLNDLRQALLNANEKVGKWNPTQIEGWSDREILRLIKEIGNGKRPDIANEVIKEYKKLKEE